MSIGKLLGITASVQTPYISENSGNSNFVKNTFNFGYANPTKPESRNLDPYAGDIKGANIYCLG